MSKEADAAAMSKEIEAEVIELALVPVIDVKVSTVKRVSIAASYALGRGRRLSGKSTRDGISLSYTRTVKSTGYYRTSRQETQTVTIPEEFIPFALDLLQKVADERAKNAD